MSTELKKTSGKPWQQALVKAETKFLAITGKEEKTKIELGFAAQLIQEKPELQACTPESILNAVINVARTGITLNPVMKLAHLVARGGKCVLDFDYKGLVKMLKDNKCCRDIQAIIVYEDEEFRESNSQIDAHKHVKKHAKTEAEHAQRKYAGVYCQVLLMDKTVIYTPFMPYHRILKVEKTSPGAGSAYSPWKKWREEMIMKTKIRYDFKTLISGNPSNELTAVIEVEDENSGAIEKNPKKGSSISDTFSDADEVKFEDVKEEKKEEPKTEKKDNSVPPNGTLL